MNQRFRQTVEDLTVSFKVLKKDRDKQNRKFWTEGVVGVTIFADWTEDKASDEKKKKDERRRQKYSRPYPSRPLNLRVIPN